MFRYPLKAVLTHRRREEDAGAVRLSQAARRRADAETEAARHDAAVVAVEHRLRAATAGATAATGSCDDPGDGDAREGGRRSPSVISTVLPPVLSPVLPPVLPPVLSPVLPTMMGVDAAGQARFVARLRDDLRRARASRAAFRSGPLLEARDAERAARADHAQARRAREALDRHEARFAEGVRRIAERRDEEGLEDVARAVRHQRGAP